MRVCDVGHTFILYFYQCKKTMYIYAQCIHFNTPVTMLCGVGSIHLKEIAHGHSKTQCTLGSGMLQP